MLSAYPALPAAQDDREDTIFRRFLAQPKSTATRMAMFEVPVALRPQTDSQAEIEENLGLNYVVSIRPRNRVFSSIGFNLGRMEWIPSAPEIASADVKQFDVTQNFNFWIQRALIIHFGIGLGLLDSLVVFANRDIEHNVVPYIPVQAGLAVPLGQTLFVGIRIVHTPFFGDGPVVGTTRLLAGAGFTY